MEGHRKREIISVEEAPDGPDDQYVLGIDLGTSTVKASLVHVATGAAVEPACQASEAYVDNPRPEEEHPEGDIQEPSKILSALWKCLGGFSAALMSKVATVAVCGQMHGVVLWKHHPEEGVVLKDEFYSPMHTWQDGRCSEEFIRGLERPNSTLRVARGYGCATLLWYARNYPDYLSRFDRAGGITDFLVCYLTRVDEVRTSVHNAASWGYFDIEKKEWNVDTLRRQGFPLRLLPSLAEIGESAGTLAQELHGVKRGTPVAVAMGDMQCAIRATLPSTPSSSSSSSSSSIAVLNINTSAQLAFLRPHGFNLSSSSSSFPSAVEDVPFGQNSFVAVAAALNGGNSLAKFVETLQLWMAELGRELPKSDIWKKIVELEKKGSSPVAGEDLMRIRPLLYSERHTPAARASATDITIGNLSLPSVVRSICTGIVENMSEMAPPELLDAAGVEKVVATGACVEKHPMLQEAVFKIFGGRSPEIVQEGNSCVGAAIFVMDSEHFARLGE